MLKPRRLILTALLVGNAFTHSLSAQTENPHPASEAFSRAVMDAFLGRSPGDLWDLPGHANSRHPGIPAIIRLQEWGQNIELGPATDLLDLNQSFHLIVGFYRPRVDDKHRATLVAVHDIVLTPSAWNVLWGNASAGEIRDLVSKIQTGTPASAHNYSLAEIGRFQMKDMQLHLRTRFTPTGRQLICSIPFSTFYKQLLGQPRPEPQKDIKLWGMTIERDIDLGAPRALMLTRQQPAPVRPTPPTTVANVPSPTAPADFSLAPLIRIDPQTGQRIVEPPQDVERLVEQMKKSSPTGQLPAAVLNAPPPPPPPADTGWTRIELDQPIRIGK